MSRGSVRARLAAGLATIERREPLYECSACAIPPSLTLAAAEDHLVFVHAVARDLAREAMVRDTLGSDVDANDPYTKRASAQTGGSS